MYQSLLENVDCANFSIPKSSSNLNTREIGFNVYIATPGSDSECQVGSWLVNTASQTTDLRSSEIVKLRDLTTDCPAISADVEKLITAALDENDMTIDVYNRYYKDDNKQQQLWAEKDSWPLETCQVTALCSNGLDHVVGYSISLRNITINKQIRLDDKVTVCAFVQDLLVVGLSNGAVLVVHMPAFEVVKSSGEGHKEDVVKIFKSPLGLLSLGKDGRAVLWNLEHLIPVATFIMLGPSKKPLLICDAAMGNEFLYVTTENGKLVRTPLVNVFNTGVFNQILKLTEMEGFHGVLGVSVSINYEKTILAAAGGHDLKLFRADAQKPFLITSLHTHIQSLQWSVRNDLLFCLTTTATYLFNVKNTFTKLNDLGGQLLAVDSQGNLLLASSNQFVKRIKLSERLK